MKTFRAMWRLFWQGFRQRISINYRRWNTCLKSKGDHTDYSSLQHSVCTTVPLCNCRQIPGECPHFGFEHRKVMSEGNQIQILPLPHEVTFHRISGTTGSVGSLLFEALEQGWTTFFFFLHDDRFSNLTQNPARAASQVMTKTCFFITILH